MSTIKPWHVMVNRHTSADGRPWGAVEGVRHLGGGAGTEPFPGVTITWFGNKGMDSAERLAMFPVLVWALSSILRDLPTNVDWLDPDVERIARDAIAKAEGR